MKKLIVLMGIFAAYSAMGQSQYTYQTKINESSVPKLTLATFKQQYPNVLVHGWNATHISYWYSDYGAGWYEGWYGPRAVVVYNFQQTNYFLVEFTKEPGEYSKALYNRHGFWYETRTQLKGLPPKILEALSKTKYADWKRAVHKEKMEAAGWPSAVYRFKVTKGLRSKIIRMDENGNIIQERDLKNEE